MSNERKLKGKIKYLIIVPIVLALILMGICIYLFGPYSKQTIAAVVALLIYIVLVIVAYIRLMPVINSTMVEYALEQGKIQNELLRDLAVPYTILDTDGHVMWANSKFYEIIGVADKKHIKKTIEAYFPQLTPAVFNGAEDLAMDIEYGNRIFNADIRRVDLTNVFLEDKAEHKDDEIVIAVYLFDVTELRRLMQENEDQKLVAGLVYIDNYDEVMDSLEDVKHSILTALVDRKINMYLSNADAIVIDSQYTVEEVYRKENWGHSSFCYAIDFAVYWNIKKVYLFHHEPAYDDKKLNSILEAARWYAQYINHSDIEIYLAKESQEIVL